MSMPKFSALGGSASGGKSITGFMMQDARYKTNGFTLVELILYVVLVGILLTAGAIFASDVVYSSVKGRVRAKVQHEATFAMEKMRQEIVKGTSITAPLQGNSDNILNLFIPGTPPSLTCFQVSSDNILQVSYGGNAAAPASCNTTWQNLTSGEVEVIAINFANISSGTSLGEEAVKIQMTLKNKNPSGKKEFDAEVNLETSISLRL